MMKSVSSVFSHGGHRFTIDLVDESLAHRTYQHAFCLKLFELGRNPSVSWDVRRLAILMAENQILKLQPDQLDEFDGVVRCIDVSVETVSDHIRPIRTQFFKATCPRIFQNVNRPEFPT